jgi:hypothetical protein
MIAQSQALDTNADSEIFLIATERKFELSSATGANFRFADAERWLTDYSDYWSVVFYTLQALNARRGAEERVSLKLLVEQLCQVWEHETQSPVAAHGTARDVYQSRAVTDAGRFVASAVEAMLPNDRGLLSALPNQCAQ